MFVKLHPCSHCALQAFVIRSNPITNLVWNLIFLAWVHSFFTFVLKERWMKNVCKEKNVTWPINDYPFTLNFYLTFNTDSKKFSIEHLLKLLVTFLKLILYFHTHINILNTFFLIQKCFVCLKNSFGIVIRVTVMPKLFPINH